MVIQAGLIPLKIDFKLGRRCVFVAGRATVLINKVNNTMGYDV
jgi:hypothetical protein